MCEGIEFSADNKYMAVVERRESKDYIGIYYTETWEMVKHFPVETFDLCDIKWAPDTRLICVWDTPLEVVTLSSAA